MSTRLQIVTEAARRLGDTTAAFLADVDSAFDFVLGDLGANDALGDLVASRSAAWFVASQRAYSTATITNLSALTPPQYPSDIVSVHVRAWGIGGALLRLRDDLFDRARGADGETAEGRPRYWRLFPNQRTLELHPIPDAAAAAETVEVVFIKPPAAIASGDELTEIRLEDVETVVFGLMARMASFKEETAGEGDRWLQLYLAGRQRMWGRLKNGRPRQIAPVKP